MYVHTQHPGALVWPLLLWTDNTYCVVLGVDLVIQHAMRVDLVIFSTAASLTLPHLTTLFRKRYDFRGKKKVTGHKMLVLIFCTTFVRNISHSKKK